MFHVFLVSETSAVICCQLLNRGSYKTVPVGMEADGLLQTPGLKFPPSHRAGQLLIS